MSSHPVRRGLPRVPGGEPWPPAGEAPAGAAATDEAMPEVPATVAAASAPANPDRPTAPAVARAVGSASPPARRGLPRVPGGEPWPPARATAPQPSADVAPESSAAAVVGAAEAVATDSIPLRRGLPRTPGGEPWPPAGTAAAAAAAQSAASAAPVTDEPAAEIETAAEAPAPARRRGLPRPGTAPAAPSTNEPAPPVSSAPAASTAVAVADRPPLPFTRTVWPGAAASAPRVSRPEPRRYGPFTRAQWTGAVVVGGGGLLFAAAMAVFAVRFLLSTGPFQDFLAAYPGEYHLPEGAPVGFPAWLAWQHFLNTFFILLIIRSGLQVRREKRPAAFWSPRGNPKRKISLALWFHQSLDILWVANGVLFVILLFVSGQWMRIIPTSWAVFPNAVSAILQYISLDWPTENGWVNYNSIQQLTYFATVFIAAPLAIVTGVRMSGIWPSQAKALTRLYPVEWARAVHFPVMLYFVAFIAVHVFLVFATGALRNLNHMYAAQGSVDPNAYADNWTGFWFFVASLVVIAAAWVAARPMVLAPIARLFGTVKGR